MKAPPTIASLVTTSLALATAVAIYAALRVGQVLLGAKQDPSLTLYDAHSGFFWRVLVSVYAAGLLFPLIAWLVRRGTLRIGAVEWALFAAGALLVAQATFAP